MTIRAVVFDWGGTLTPWHDVDHRAEWLSFAGAWDEAPDDLVDRLMAACSNVWQRSREEHTSARMDDVLRAAGIDPDDARHLAARAAHEEFWDPHTRTDPAVKPMWESLRADGFGVGVLSNTIWSRHRHEEIFERDGVLHLIDGAVYSSEIEYTKPHPEAFLAAARAVDAAPDEIVFVGDRLFEDVHGPQQVGMRTIWLPHSRIPAEQQVETGAGPDAVAQSLDDVVDILDAWTHR